jgi:hypothetical protein
MDARVAALVVALAGTIVSGAALAGAQISKGPQTSTKERTMSDDVAAELKRLRQNQATLMAAVNRLITQTAPIELANPGDMGSGYVTTGLVLDADGLIVPGRIPAPMPPDTVRGVRPGDPLWVERPGSP